MFGKVGVNSGEGKAYGHQGVEVGDVLNLRSSLQEDP